MLQRNLIYTGLTRGKRLVVIVGQKKAVSIAVRNVSGRKRWSKLREWLAADQSIAQPACRTDVTGRERLCRASRDPMRVKAALEC